MTRSLVTGSLVDMIVSHRAPLATVLRKTVVVGLGELGDDVPGVEEAGNETETAERDIDEGVCGAEAALDPDYVRG